MSEGADPDLDDRCAVVGVPATSPAAVADIIINSLPPDPNEPNDSSAAATEIACGFTSSETNIDPLGDVDFYTFTLVDDQLVSIDIDANILGSSLDSTLGLFDSVPALITTSDDDPAPGEPSSVDSFISTALAAGTYFIATSSFPDFTFDGVDAGSTGIYLLNLECAPPPVVAPNCLSAWNPFDNCGFESGDFSSWVIQDIGDPFVPLAVVNSGVSPGFGLFSSEPTEGTLAAVHGFDGDGPGTIRIAQDVTLPAEPGMLKFDYRAGWDLLTFGATLDRNFTVNIEPSGGGGLLQSNLVLTALAGDITLDTTPLTGLVDLSDLAGQSVRISFDAEVPEELSGPAFFQLDNVRFQKCGLYGSSNTGEIFFVDVNTGVGALVGNLADEVCPNFSGATEIEYDNVSNRAFAQTPNGSFCGFEFDISNGATIGAAVPNGGSFTGLETIEGTWYGTVIFDGDGNNPSELRTLNPFTGTSTLIGATGVGAIAGLAYDRREKVMYGIAGGPGPANLYTIDLATGVASVVGSTGIQAGSLQFADDSNLYAGGTGADAGNLFRIDPVSGGSTLLGATGFATVTGLTMVCSNTGLIFADGFESDAAPPQ
jgi:hypothetical protein